jgi:tetratricopeptide (TPR) repeat protein
LFLFIPALVVKAAVLYALRDHPLLQPRGDLDEAVYVALANQSTNQPFFVSPLYIYFLRAVGVSLLAARVVQIILGSVAVVLIFDTARRWFGERAAIIAAVLSILTGVISFYEVTILQAALDPFLVALTLWLLSRALLQNSMAWFAVAGFALALLVLNRPNAILLLPLLALAVGLLLQWRTAAALLVGFILPVASVTVRNYVVSRQFVLIASHGGLNLYIGNNPQADGTYHHVPGIRPTIAGQEEDAPRVAAAAGWRDASAYFTTMAVRWIRSHPAEAARLFVRKVAYTFNETDLALNYSYSYFRRDVVSPLRLLVVGPWLLFPLGIVGALRHLRNKRFAIWASFVPVYAISVAIFFVSSRYRLPLLVPMCITAGAFFAGFRIWHAVLAAIVAVGVCWNFGLDDGRAHEKTNMAVDLIEQHQYAAAAQVIAEAEKITRDPTSLHARAAAAYAREGKTDAAFSLLQRVDPASLDAGESAELAKIARAAGIADVQSNQQQEAIEAFETAHRLDPADASDLLNIAVLQAEQGDTTSARENARAALRLRPNYPQALGLLRTLEGR